MLATVYLVEKQHRSKSSAIITCTPWVNPENDGSLIRELVGGITLCSVTLQIPLRKRLPV